ncbi:hypothetical protein E5673_14015 [Sphingomonas sp. PAMC26645]|uniref:hypothetical protein n=1 Tax=Sphingomonas sp. PAMC26645 TaxID=2565555 RepID=UPI00109DC120|nr:hypothetical protein [Sphingomonas sp. PAMC26645]QCB43196.1 hypothetical protein E5673_14015 [Sphingomonas sp. PAMC26645]
MRFVAPARISPSSSMTRMYLRAVVWATPDAAQADVMETALLFIVASNRSSSMSQAGSQNRLDGLTNRSFRALVLAIS